MMMESEIKFKSRINPDALLVFLALKFMIEQFCFQMLFFFFVKLKILFKMGLPVMLCYNHFWLVKPFSQFKRITQIISSIKQFVFNAKMILWQFEWQKVGSSTQIV